MFEIIFVWFVSQNYGFPVAKFMIFITFKRHDKTCSKYKKNLVSLNSLAGKTKNKTKQ